MGFVGNDSTLDPFATSIKLSDDHNTTALHKTHTVRLEMDGPHASLATSPSPFRTEVDEIGADTGGDNNIRANANTCATRPQLGKQYPYFDCVCVRFVTLHVDRYCVHYL